MMALSHLSPGLCFHRTGQCVLLKEVFCYLPVLKLQGYRGCPHSFPAGPWAATCTCCQPRLIWLPSLLTSWAPWHVVGSE